MKLSTLILTAAAVAALPHASCSTPRSERGSMRALVDTDTALPARPAASPPPGMLASRQAVKVTTLAPHAASQSALIAHSAKSLPVVASTSAAAGGASPLATALVRVWLTEARWLAHRDHAIQAHVLQRWATRMGTSLETAIDIRVTRWSRAPKWIARVDERCVEPRGWPRRWSWASHADECRALFANASAFLRGELPDVCPRAEGWRSPAAALQAFAMGRVRVNCGRTVNVYVRSRG